jgi:hypothetical protein
MIKKLESGHYTLIETKSQTKILTLNDVQTFAWIDVTGIGEILVTSHKKHNVDCILSVGKYILYSVKNEPKFTDLDHLELNVGDNLWQGYLLPTGLPSQQDIRNRIIPTKEIITK